MSELLTFIREGLGAGKNKEELRDVLARAGWPADEIDDGLSRFSDVPFAIPVPTRRASGSARDTFLYLVTFVALYSSVIAFGALLFGLVDHLFPDPVVDAYSYYGNYRSEALRWNIATLIVSFPLYMGLTVSHLKAYFGNPERRTSPVRRWFTYLTLFVAACVIAGDLIALIGNVLGGELAARFVLKALVVLVLSLSVFSFYLWELRATDRGRAK